MTTSLSPDLIDQIRNSPAADPPPGIIPNFTDPPNLTRTSIGLVIAGMVIIISVALIRFYTRVFCLKRVRVEDCSLYLYKLGLAFTDAPQISDSYHW